MLLELTVMPHLRIAEGIPDLVAAAVVSIAILRGPVVGAVAGFSAGLLLELTAPIGSLGVLALLYLGAGVFAGRYTDRPEAESLLMPLMLAVAVSGVVQALYAGSEALLGANVDAAFVVSKVLIPQMALTALLAPPVLLVARRILGAPRVVEPYAMVR